MQIYNVSDINARVKELIDGDGFLSDVYVRGEISNFKLHSSGHIYMTLKDENGVLRAVMFKASASKLIFSPENGMKVIAHGRISAFPRDGSYQIYIDSMTPDGIGALYVAYEQLKKKLDAEGLFRQEHKKPIPRFPSRIAIVTSPTGAAIRDMLRILKARYPLARVRIFPVRVQGSEAPPEICEGIRFINTYRLADLIITGRGGGSIEDLWAFNDESVARAIFASEIPVISAVGHEPDVTISDFVADLRAATPSNAAELATPDSQALQSALDSIGIRLRESETKLIKIKKEKLLSLSSKRVLTSPKNYLDDRRMVFEHTRQRLEASMNMILQKKKGYFERSCATLNALSPANVLSRGYSILYKSDGAIVKSTDDISIGERLRLSLGHGSAVVGVEEIEHEL